MAVRRTRIAGTPEVEVSPRYVHTNQWMAPKKSMGERLFPLMAVVMVVMAFVLGSLWTKVQYLQNNPPTTTTTAQPAAQAAAQPPAKAQVTIDQMKAVFNKSTVKFGDANRKVLFVEIADPSCPFCHIAGGMNPQLNAQSAQFKLVADGGTYLAPVVEMRKLVDQGRASFAYIYFPGHGNGEMATKAMYCAYDQGKFWPVHDRLMTSEAYDKINNEFKNDKAQAGAVADFVGNLADKGKLLGCLESGKYDAKLAEEQQLAMSMGVQGTPGFFVNTKNFGGAYNWTDMKADVEAALN